MNRPNYNPLEEIKNLREQMSKFLEAIPYEKFFGFHPYIDVYENNDYVIVEADIPGIKPENIEITVSENQVNIKGKLEKKTAVNKENYHRAERRFGSFSRNISLPSRVKHREALANINQGVLEIRLPKVESESEKSTKLKFKN